MKPPTHNGHNGKGPQTQSFSLKSRRLESHVVHSTFQDLLLRRAPETPSFENHQFMLQRPVGPWQTEKRLQESSHGLAHPGPRAGQPLQSAQPWGERGSSASFKASDWGALACWPGRRPVVSFCAPSALLKPAGTIFFFLFKKTFISFIFKKIFLFKKLKKFFQWAPSLHLPPTWPQLGAIFPPPLPSRAGISWRGAATLARCPGFYIWWPSFYSCSPGDAPPFPGSGGQGGLEFPGSTGL